MTIKRTQAGSVQKTTALEQKQSVKSRGTAALAGLNAPGGKAAPARRDAATRMLKPISAEAASKPAMQKKARAALDFIEVLSPRQSIGFRFSTAAYHALPEATKAVMNTFARMYEHVSKQAGAYGVGEPSRQTMGNDLHPQDVNAALDEALKPFRKKSDQAGQILKSAANARGQDPLLRDHLLEVAAKWDGRATDPGWKAAQTLRAVELPPPPVLSSAESTKVRFQEQAEREWDNAPRARGYSPSEGRRELLKEYVWNRDWPEPDIRAFTRENWMSWRVSQLEKQAAEPPRDIPHWRL